MKNKIITYTFLIYIVAFSVMHIAFEDSKISKSERRTLAVFPDFELTSNYITKLEKYLLDHFPYRDDFRNIKATYNYNVLGKFENNSIYLSNDSIYKSNYPTNKDSITNFINKVNIIKNMLTPNNKTYMMLVPDKNYYLEDKNFLHLDYDYIYNEVNTLDMTHIDIRNIMNKEDYYKTDTHWKQENLSKVVEYLSKYMNFEYKKEFYTKNTYDKFYGVYYGESAVKRDPETITYLTSDIIDNAKVYYLENDNLTSVYSKDKLTSLDSYEVYLDGASSYIEITNNNSATDKELVIFRDSFGSSISPLLIKYYSKITLIDNRYISSSNFLNYITFKDQDVLFLYSTLIVNTSNTLKG